MIILIRKIKLCEIFFIRNVFYDSYFKKIKNQKRIFIKKKRNLIHLFTKIISMRTKFQQI